MRYKRYIDIYEQSKKKLIKIYQEVNDLEWFCFFLISFIRSVYSHEPHVYTCKHGETRRLEWSSRRQLVSRIKLRNLDWRTFTALPFRRIRCLGSINQSLEMKETDSSNMCFICSLNKETLIIKTNFITLSLLYLDVLTKMIQFLCFLHRFQRLLSLTGNQRKKKNNWAKKRYWIPCRNCPTIHEICTELTKV